MHLYTTIHRICTKVGLHLPKRHDERGIRNTVDENHVFLVPNYCNFMMRRLMHELYNFNSWLTYNHFL